MPTSNGTITVEDYDGERSTISVNLQDIDTTGSNYGSVTQDLDEIKDAVLPLIRGQVRYTQLSVQFPESAAAVSDKEAAREAKWLVTYKDTTQYLATGNLVANPGFGKLFTFEIPTANRSLLANNSDELALDTGAGATAKAALEPNLRSPFNRASAGVTPTNEVVSIKYVGRNI
ncbi:MAG: hypothetical protein KF716_14210 [Anaerolineae bacterium]|nr:hypothetical protein [Anaerolineae bacterium]